MFGALAISQKGAETPPNRGGAYAILFPAPQVEENTSLDRTPIEIKLPPPDYNKLLEDKTLLDTLHSRSDRDAVEASVDRLPPETLTWIGCEFLLARKIEQAELCFDRLLRHWPESPLSRIGWCGKAWVYSARDDRLQAITALERAEPWRLEIVGGDEPVWQVLSAACSRLGFHYLGQAEWEKSRVCWEQWRPINGCGSCQASMEEGQRTFLGYCQLHSRQYDEFCEETLPQVCSGRFTGRRSYAAYQLWMLYERAGQEENLLAMTREARKLEKADADRMYSRRDPPATLQEMSRLFPAHAIAYCAELKRLRETRNVRQLLQELAVGSSNFPTEAHLSDWQPRAIAEALAECGREALPWIADCLKTGHLPEASNWTISRPWLYYTLGRMQGMGAARLLTDARYWKALSWPERPAIYFAMRMQGDRFRSIASSFERQFGGPQEKFQQSADSALKYLQLERGWPAPPAGSLPTEPPPLPSDRELSAKR